MQRKVITHSEPEAEARNTWEKRTNSYSGCPSMTFLRFLVRSIGRDKNEMLPPQRIKRQRTHILFAILDLQYFKEIMRYRMGKTSTLPKCLKKVLMGKKGDPGKKLVQESGISNSDECG